MICDHKYWSCHSTVEGSGACAVCGVNTFWGRPMSETIGQPSLSELVERLRHDEVRQGPNADPLCQEAADTIARLSIVLSERDALREALAGAVKRFAEVPDHLAQPWLKQARAALSTQRSDAP